MKRVIPFLVFLLIPFTLHAESWKFLEPGLRYKPITFKQDKTGSVSYTLHAFKIDPGKFAFKALFANKEEKYEPIRKMVENSGAVLGVNSNFFDESGKPLGLIVSDGQILHPKRDISWWGIFYLFRNIPHLVHSSQWKMDDKINYAVQTGPRLVVGGKIPRLKTEQSQKTAIGLNKSGDVILVTTLYPMSIQELAKIMAKPEDKGGLGCLDALNLDGGSSSQMYAKSGTFELRLPSYLGVPVGLGIFRK